MTIIDPQPVDFAPRGSETLRPRPFMPPSRNALLGIAASVLCCGTVLGSVAATLGFAQSFDGERLGPIAAGGLAMCGAFILVAAFASAALAFLATPAGRSQRLALAFFLAAVAFLLSAVSHFVSTYVYATTDFLPGTGIAFMAVGGIAAIVGAGAAWVGAVAFFRAQVGGLSTRNWRLAWAAALASGNFLLGAVALVLQTAFYSKLGATSQLSAGLGIAAAGNFISTAALVVAATGFFASVSKQQQGIDWLDGRESLLGIAAAIFAIAYAIVSVGLLVGASAMSANGFDGTLVASGWLRAVEALLVLTAAACASAGFLLRRIISPGPVATNQVLRDSR